MMRGPRAKLVFCPLVVLAALSMSVSALASPSNNSFASATSITTIPYSDAQNTSGATLEAGEPRPCGAIAATVWYRFTAAAPGAISVETTGSTFDTVLAVYTGNSVDALSLVGCNNNAIGVQSRVGFSAVAGTTYSIQAGGSYGETGDLRFALSIATPPSAPQALTATAGPHAGQITLSWTPPASDGGAGVDRYNISRATTSGAETVIGSASYEAFTDTGLLYGTTYFYEVSAISIAGEGPRSNEAGSIAAQPPANDDFIHATTIPAAPYSDALATGAASLETGEPSCTPIGGSVWYRYAPASGGTVGASTRGSGFIATVAVYTGTSLDALTQVGCRTFFDGSSDLKFTAVADTTYYIQVAGWYGGTGPLVFSLDVPPGAPTAVAAAGGLKQITLSWLPPERTGGAPITGYNIYRGSTSGTETLVSFVRDSNSFTQQDLGYGATYFYEVSAVNPLSEGPRSDEVIGSTMTTPGIPRDVTATAGLRKITITWKPPASDGGAPISSYTVYRGTASGGEIPLATLGKVLEFTDEPLTDRATYWYEVRATNSIGRGPLSNESSATTFAPPDAPRNLTAIPGADVQQVALEWQAPASDGGTPVTRYRIYRSTAPGEETLLTTLGDVRGFIDSELQPLQTYYYRIVAINKVGPSPFSIEACTKPFPWLAALGC